ncbi:MAG: hypothetical protein GEEBNDBF_02603 [bacterium]|nr:hypothetical protein [bacterium]
MLTDSSCAAAVNRQKQPYGSGNLPVHVGSGWVLLLMLSVILGCGCASASQQAAREQEAFIAQRLNQSEEQRLFNSLQAFAIAIGTATRNQDDVIHAWLGGGQPELESPLPLVPFDAQGELMPIRLDVMPPHGWRCYKSTNGLWYVEAPFEGKTKGTWFHNVGPRPKDELELPHILRFSIHDPLGLQLLHGIARGLLFAPASEVPGGQWLEKQLGLRIPPQTLEIIEQEVGPVEVWHSQAGQWRFHYEVNNTRWVMFATSENYIIEYATPPSSEKGEAPKRQAQLTRGEPSAGKKFRNQRFAMIVHESLLDSQNSLVWQYKTDQPGVWRKLPAGLLDL